MATRAKKKTARKKAIPKKKQSRKSPGSKEQDKCQPIPNFGVLFYLRGTSRAYPRKIGKFLKIEELEKWIYEGRAIPIEEWNTRAEAIIDDVQRNFGDQLLLPATKIVEIHDHEETAKPIWKQNIEKAHAKQRAEVATPDPDTTREEQTPENEFPPTPEPTFEEALY